MPDNRQRLLKVALKLFASRGYDAAGVQEIAAEAGVTKPTLYHYFGSKAGLLDTLIRESTRDFLTAFDEAAHYAGDLTLSLSRVLDVTLEFAKRRPDVYRLLMMLLFLPIEHEARRIAAPVFYRQIQALEAMFLAASRDHGNMRGRHARYATTFHGHLNSSVVLVMNGTLTDDDRLRHDVVHQFSHGIYS
ncbi:HTH-type transcriptional repressor KstR2 [compost metagenome]